LVEMDGCELRTGTLTKAAGEERTAVRKLPKRVRQTEWREVRVGLARPLDQVDPTYVARMDKYPAVVGALFGAACERGLSDRDFGPWGKKRIRSTELIFSRWRLDTVEQKPPLPP